MSEGSCYRCIKKVQSSTIEEDDLGKAKSFRLFSIQRPHMRAFHSSWFCFFIAFTSWFGIQPLVPTIRKELDLTKKEVANSGIASIAATIIVRAVVGPLCDKFGPRRVMSAILIIGSIPLAFAGLVKSATGLIIVRLCIGLLGGAFIPCQFWSSAMFNVKIVGTANAFVGGWGNLGGGFTFLLMPALFEMVKYFGCDDFLAWKMAVLFPVCIAVTMGVSILWTTDDCPQGKWSDRKLPPQTQYVKEHQKSFRDDIVIVPSTDNEKGLNYKALPTTEEEIVRKKEEPVPDRCNLQMVASIAVLVIQYGLCFGVEIAVNTVMNLYFLYKFKIEGCVEGASSAMLTRMEGPTEVVYTNLTNGTLVVSNSASVNSVTNDCSILTQNSASLITSLFGLMNLFARALGGIFSDVLRKYYGIPGRLLAHFVCLTCEGLLLIVFSQMTTIPSAVAVMVCFSLFVQMSEGSTFAIVPYVNPRRIGVVAGLVGAGGNVGAMVWNTIWSQIVDTDPSRWFWLLGVFVLCGNILTLMVSIQNRRIWHLFYRK